MNKKEIKIITDALDIYIGHLELQASIAPKNAQKGKASLINDAKKIRDKLMREVVK